MAGSMLYSDRFWAMGRAFRIFCCRYQVLFSILISEPVKGSVILTHRGWIEKNG
jgi:hypothetical protein